MTPRIKRLCKSLLLRLGYEIQPVCKSQPNIDFTAALTVKESEYYTRWSPPCPLFTPWVGHPDFQTIYEGVAPYTIVSPDRCYVLVSLARYARLIKGDFAECGVYKGGTAVLLSRVLKGSQKTLYLFDSFEGLPKVNPIKDQWFQEGQFANRSVESVKELLAEFQDFTVVRQGWIPDTFAGLEDNRYAFVHIDVDLYRSALDCCDYFYPRLMPGGVLLFDEYGFPAARGEKEAVDEYFSDKPESPITLLTGQAMLLKVPTY